MYIRTFSNIKKYLFFGCTIPICPAFVEWWIFDRLSDQFIFPFAFFIIFLSGALDIQKFTKPFSPSYDYFIFISSISQNWVFIVHHKSSSLCFISPKNALFVSMFVFHLFYICSSRYCLSFGLVSTFSLLYFERISSDGIDKYFFPVFIFLKALFVFSIKTIFWLLLPSQYFLVYFCNT